MAMEQGELNIETKLDGALIIKNDVNNKITCITFFYWIYKINQLMSVIWGKRLKEKKKKSHAGSLFEKANLKILGNKDKEYEVGLCD